MKGKSAEKKRPFLCTRIICIVFFAIGLAAIGWVYWRATSPYSTFYSQLRPLQGKIMDIKKEDLEEAEITIYSRKGGTGAYLINDEEGLAALADYLNRVRFWAWVRTDWRPTHSAVDIRLRFKKPVPEPKWENSGDLRMYIYYHTPENGGPIPKDFCTLQMDNAKYAVDMKYLQEIVELWRERERTGSIPPAERWGCNAFTGASAFDLEQCPMYREFGLDQSFLDKPLPVAKTMLRVLVKEAIEEWEPRAAFVDMTFAGDPLDPASLCPVVTVEVREE